MAATKTKTAEKIELLRTLIDHPRTGAEERDTAKRMLLRLLAKAKEAGEQLHGEAWSDHRVYGAKYADVRHLRLVDIAKLMRADIKLASSIALKTAARDGLAVPDPIADAPAGIKFGVVTETYSGGGSIDIVIRNIPDDWGYVQQRNPRGELYRKASPALLALAEELKAIHRAYNYNGSDLTTDYFDVNYYGGVCDGPGGRFS